MYGQRRAGWRKVVGLHNVLMEPREFQLESVPSPSPFCPAIHKS